MPRFVAKERYLEFCALCGKIDAAEAQDVVLFLGKRRCDTGFGVAHIYLKDAPLNGDCELEMKVTYERI